MKAICVLTIVLLIGATSSCRRHSSNDTITRLEAGKAVEEDFRSAVVGLYPSDSKVPELATTLSRDGISFTLTATNERDLETVAPTIAKILKRNGIESASLVLIGTEIVLEGVEYRSGETSYILGGYRIYDDGRVEKKEADTIIKDSIDAASRISKRE